jgi:hypothetical protein
MSQPRYPRKNFPRYPLDRRMDGPQGRSGQCGDDKNLAIRKSNPALPSRSPSLHRLSYPDSSILCNILYSHIPPPFFSFGPNTMKIVQKKENSIPDVRFELLKAMTMKIAVFWDLTFCSLVTSKRWHLSTTLHGVTSQKKVTS